MSRPLIISDCDEVLLHMVVPFRAWLDEVHNIRFNLSAAHGDFADALLHKDSEDPVERQLVWQLLSGFFVTEMHRQQPIAGAVEAITALSRDADILILTNIGEEVREGRAQQLAQVGIPHPVHCNRGGKGPAVLRLIADRQKPNAAPGPVFFIDDLSSNHESVAEHAPHVWRIHMVGEPELAPAVAPSPYAHVRIDDWGAALEWIGARMTQGHDAPIAA